MRHSRQLVGVVKKKVGRFSFATDFLLRFLFLWYNSEAGG